MRTTGSIAPSFLVGFLGMFGQGSRVHPDALVLCQATRLCVGAAGAMASCTTVMLTSTQRAESSAPWDAHDDKASYREPGKMLSLTRHQALDIFGNCHPIRICTADIGNARNRDTDSGRKTGGESRA